MTGRRAGGALGALAALLLTAGPGAGQEEGRSGYDLDTLRVEVASRLAGGLAARGRATQVLTREELETLPVASVQEALRWAAGVELGARSPAQADLSIRGSSFEQVLVLVDGVRMSDPQTGHFDLDLTVPLALVERIEILRGPASAMYGADAVGGVVHVVTRKGEQAVRGVAEGGSWGSARAAVSGGASPGDRIEVAAAGEWGRSDGHRDGADHEMILAHGTTRASVGSGTATLTAGHARRDFGAQGFYAPFDSFEETRTTTTALGWSGDVGGVVLAPRATVRRHDDDFLLRRDEPDGFRNVHTSTQWGGEVVARTALGGDVSVAVGAEGVRESIESNVLGDRDEDRGGLFAEAAFLGRPVTVSAGLRVDRYEAFGAAWSPSVSLAVDATDGVRVRAAWGRAFRPPTWTERYYEDPANVGTPELDPERSWTGEAGLELRPAVGALFRVTAFRREARDLIDWARPADAGSGDDAPRWETRNVEEATFDGMEATAAWRVGGFLASAEASLLDVSTEERSDLVSKGALRPLTRRIGAGLSRELLGGRLGLSARLLHARRRGGGEGQRWTLLDLRAETGVPGGRLYLDLTNATDADHLDIAGNPAPGRAVRVGYRVVPR